jgi:hypothetical protein
MRGEIKAAIWGALIFATLTIVPMVAIHHIGGKSGDFWPDTLLLSCMVVGAPSAFVIDLLGFQNAPWDSFLRGSVFCVLVNALLGAIILACIVGAFKFGTKVDFEE